MVTFLLAVIYLAFISLGLPDSILGSAWPLMVEDLSVPLSYAGIVSFIVSAGTIVSSLMSDKLTGRFGAGKVTAVSVAMTACALAGFSFSGSFVMLCLFAVPYGLGAGAVDAALNNYVALHYASRHMNWLHCFWGVGTSIGPYILGWAVGAGHGWRTGYGVVSVLQIILTAGLFLSLPLWKKTTAHGSDGPRPHPHVGLRYAVSLRGVKAMLLAFFGYCAFEATAILWGSSYLVEHHGVDAETAAFFGSLYVMGITAGRFVSGFVSDRVGDKRMIRIGIGVTLTGALLIALPLQTALPSLIGLVVLGVGSAPVYPSIIHSTPKNFGAQNSQAIVGIQMAGAYCGSTLAPPVFGLLAQYLDIALFPFYMLLFIGLLLIMTERVNRQCA